MKRSQGQKPINLLRESNMYPSTFYLSYTICSQLNDSQVFMVIAVTQDYMSLYGSLNIYYKTLIYIFLIHLGTKHADV